MGRNQRNLDGFRFRWICVSDEKPHQQVALSSPLSSQPLLCCGRWEAKAVCASDQEHLTHTKRFTTNRSGGGNGAAPAELCRQRKPVWRVDRCWRSGRNRGAGLVCCIFRSSYLCFCVFACLYRCVVGLLAVLFALCKPLCHCLSVFFFFVFFFGCLTFCIFTCV